MTRLNRKGSWLWGPASAELLLPQFPLWVMEDADSLFLPSPHLRLRPGSGAGADRTVLISALSACWLLTQCHISGKTRAGRGYCCGQEAAAGFWFLRCVCTQSQCRGGAARRHFPFPNPSLAAAAPGLGHPLHEALLQGPLSVSLTSKVAAVRKTGIISCFPLCSLLNTCLEQRSAAFRTQERAQLVLSSLVLSLSICVGEAAHPGPWGSVPWFKRGEKLRDGWRGQAMPGKKG